jgi:hypothetical protein
MKNKMLEITRGGIPYLKEFNKYTNSPISTILMQQLDYWFAKKPNGFFKFKAPCEHKAYQIGDSWIEELDFSEEVFTTAFKNIGIAYKSKTEYLSNTGREFLVHNQEAGVEIEKMYCSYYDRKEGLTYYFRNHNLVDSIINECISRNRVSQLLETEIVDLHKPQMSGSFIYNTEKDSSKEQQKSTTFKNNKKSTILSEKEILFEEFYKLYNNKTEITEKTKETKGYQKTKQRFLKETKTAKEEDVLQGTRDYLSFIAFERKRGFNRPLKDIDTFINQNAWEGDKGIPWSELIDRNIGNEKETLINKITAPNAYEIKKQIKQQERFLLLDDDMPS